MNGPTPGDSELRQILKLIVMSSVKLVLIQDSAKEQIMKINIQKGLLGAILVFTAALHPSLNQKAEAQEQPALSVRQRFVIVPANQRCQPAAVKTVSFGKQPPDSLLAQVMIENRSDKTLAEVKLGWRVYNFPEGTHVSLAFCDAQLPSAEVFLSGATRLIQLEGLAPKETGTISINPLVLPTTATKTVFIDHPLLTTGDVKSLPLDSPTPIIKYVVVMFVSEIHYADGTAWELKGN
jgi:hypothetical protein